MKREDFYKLFLEQIPKDLPYLSVVQHVKGADWIDIFREGKHLLHCYIDGDGYVGVHHYDLWKLSCGARMDVFEMMVLGDDIEFYYPDHSLTVLKDDKVLVNLVI